MKAGLITALLLTATVAGCVDSEPATDLRAGALARLSSLMADVPCEVSVDPSTGGATSDNLLTLDLAPFEEGVGAEIDRTGNVLVAGRKGAGGFDVFVLEDPAAPQRVAQVYQEEGFSSRDVKFDPDGDTLFVATGGLTIDMHDMRDPSQPVLVGTFALPQESGRLRDAHMLWTHHLAGQDWLFVATLSNEGVWIYRITGGPADPGLEYVTQTSPIQGGPLGVHDMWITYDEEAKAHWLYASDGFMGWTVWNVDDPRAPILVATVPNADPYQGYVHTVQAQWIGGRRIVATIAEVGHDALKVYDATDITRPILLATWQQDPVMDPTTPQHNLQLVDGLLYVAHYTRGIFIFDLRGLPDLPLSGIGSGAVDAVAGLQPIARYASDVAPGLGPNAWDEFWDVVLVDGVLYTADYTGLHTVGFACIEPGDATHTSLG